MSPYYSVQMWCSVFNACVRNCMLSTHTSKTNSTLGTFSDMCPERKIYDKAIFKWDYQPPLLGPQCIKGRLILNCWVKSLKFIAISIHPWRYNSTKKQLPWANQTNNSSSYSKHSISWAPAAIHGYTSPKFRLQIRNNFNGKNCCKVQKTVQEYSTSF